MLVVIALLGASPVDSEIDLILDRSQWETLRALGAPDADQRPVDKLAIERLVAAKLAEMRDGRPDHHAHWPRGRRERFALSLGYVRLGSGASV